MKILILDDGKVGHTKQSVVVADLITRKFSKSSFIEKEVTVKTIKVFFDNIFQKFIYKILFGLLIKSNTFLNLMVKLFPPSRLTDLRSYDPDLIISCGFVSSCISAISPAKSVIKIAILYPGNIYSAKFDLIITPAHDSKNIETTKNIVTTKLSLTNNSMATSSLERSSNMGLLMGGTNRSYRYTKRYSRRIAEQMVILAKSRKQVILWTFSRRTPNYLAEYFDNLTSCELNSKYFECMSTPDAVNTILKECHWVLVSADSISMISEALAAGCRVTVFGSRNRFFYSKRHKKFIDSMVALGAINSCEINQISSQCYPLQKVNIERLFLVDRNNISESIDKLLSKIISYSSQ